MAQFEDPDVEQFVLDDLERSFATSEEGRGLRLPPAGEFDEAAQLLGEFGVMSNDLASAVAWRYTGVHSERFLGLEPTGRTIEVEGITIVTPGEGEPELTRLIDWHSVYVQIGSARGGHPVTTPGDVEFPDPEQLPNGLTEQQMRELFG